MGSHPAGTDQSRRTAPNGCPRPLDLSAFAPSVFAPPRLWQHAIRALDPESRLRVHELAELVGFDGTNLAAVLHRGRWELRSAPARLNLTSVDSQRRVTVPVGVRHQLGLEGPVLVSLAADRSRIVISSSAHLDSLLEDPS